MWRVVVGGGAAGATAASKAKRANLQAEAILVEAGPYVTHAPCVIPYALGRAVRAASLHGRGVLAGEGHQGIRQHQGRGGKIKLSGARGFWNGMP